MGGGLAQLGLGASLPVIDGGFWVLGLSCQKPGEWGDGQFRPLMPRGGPVPLPLSARAGPRRRGSGRGCETGQGGGWVSDGVMVCYL